MDGKVRCAVKGENRLKNELSPYLLQHKDNPVDWYSWGDDAFDAARQADKPIFLSIGYSTCHWCHVMEHESFEDEEVAEQLNRAFVCIKVDREERPDIDNVYMRVCQMMTGGGGWPLTILMTPDKKPFFAGTYIPKQSRFGRLGMLELITIVDDMWKDEREKLLASTEKVMAGLKQSDLRVPGELGWDHVEKGYQELVSRYDTEYGGFGDAPKFPMPHSLSFLLSYWKQTGQEQALDMVKGTLLKMRAGGVYDHVGFGYHRYATDRRWLLPHFEKMLYDQALLLMVYADMYQITHETHYKQVAGEIVDYLQQELVDEQGGFYSAEDADSEGVEGKFYVWRYDALRDVLDDDNFELAIRAYGIYEEGNFADEASWAKTGENILHLVRPIGELAAEMGILEDDLAGRLDAIRKQLFDVRDQRVRPGKDDKVLTDWNGLMIAALAKVARAFDDDDVLTMATRAADFILDSMMDSQGRLLHRWRHHQRAIAGCLDDYAFMIWGLFELYQISFNERYLSEAVRLTEVMVEDFWDDQAGGFYFSSRDNDDLLMRQKEIYDGAIPSGNSVAMHNLLRLSRLLGRTDWEQLANKLANVFASDVQRMPSAYTHLLSGLIFAHGRTREVVLVGDKQASGTQSMLGILNKRYRPGTVVLLKAEHDPSVESLASYAAGMRMIDGKATAYVCHGNLCDKPVTELDL